MQITRKALLLYVVIALGSLPAQSAQGGATLDSSELQPVFRKLNLYRSTRTVSMADEITAIEAADAAIYRPAAGTTIFLEVAAPTRDSNGLKPRYWLRVEDYKTTEAARKRAAEYKTEGTDERLEKVYTRMNSLEISKTSVRQWAIVRGKRVYALTTTVSLFTQIELPRKLKSAIEALPEI